jgi:SmpA / OmlA family
MQQFKALVQQRSSVMAMAAVFAGVLALAGCDQAAKLELQAGASTADDVVKMMGKAEMIWDEADGSRTMEYPRGPAGLQTYMVKIGADGKYISMLNVLTEANFAKLKPGMKPDEVRRIIGKPATVVPMKLQNEDVWSWKYSATQPSVRMFNAHFEPGGGPLKSTSFSDIHNQN